MRFIIITGMSGAGKSTVTKELEDMGYYCVDNMPPSLIPKFIDICSSANGKLDNVAFVADSRGGEDVFLDLILELEKLKEAGHQYEILFLDADDDTIIRRYKTTRRTHPIAEKGSILLGVQKERNLLEGIKSIATYLLNTSTMTTKELKEKLTEIFCDEDKKNRMYITVKSFGFKYGVPIDCDLIFDVRFLPNPFHIDELRVHNGNEVCVQDYVMKFEQSKVFLAKLVDMMEYLIPYYEEEGKPHLVICIGCTGGCHRSVTIANRLYELLAGKYDRINIIHNDILKDQI